VSRDRPARPFHLRHDVKLWKMKGMKVLLTAIGSPGDINPTLAIGQALKTRGHQATMLVNPYFKRQTTEAGLKFLPLGTDEQLRGVKNSAFMRHPARRTGWSELVMPNIPLLLEELDAHVRADPPDLVVYHQLSIGAPWVCRRHDVPSAVVTLSPLTWMSREDGGVHSRTGMRDSPPKWMLRLILSATNFYLRSAADKDLNLIRERFGYSHSTGFWFEHIKQCELNLGMWSPYFRRSMPDDPPNGRICGFAWCDRGHDDEREHRELLEFLDEGEPPIVFTMGTSVVTAVGNFYETAAEACRRLGRRGLLLIGREENRPKRMPPGVMAACFAPHSLVFPRACLNVHHGGAGTTAQAMRGGKPALVIPIAFDQFDNAARVKRLGIAKRLWRQQVSPRLLTMRLRQILDSAGIAARAARVGDRLRQEDGADAAAKLLEQTFAKQSSLSEIGFPREVERHSPTLKSAGPT